MVKSSGSTPITI